MGGEDTATTPASSSADDKIPDPEDPLSGLTDEQVTQSLETFGRNEVRQLL